MRSLPAMNIPGPIETDAAQIRLSSLHSLTQGGDWRSRAMRSHAAPRLLWITRGQGRISVSGLTRGFGAHSVIFLPARTMHGFHFAGPVFGSIVAFAPNQEAGLPSTPCHFRIRDAQAQAELTLLIDQIQRETQQAQPAAPRAIGHYGGLITVWLERQRACNEDTFAARDAAQRLALRFGALVEAEFRTPLSISDYAARLGVSPTHLTRVCKESCGMTASAFLSARKIAEARRLLADTRRPIKDIAAELGFASPAYFTRSFHARIGMAPGAFRRSV